MPEARSLRSRLAQKPRAGARDDDHAHVCLVIGVRSACENDSSIGPEIAFRRSGQLKVMVVT